MAKNHQGGIEVIEELQSVQEFANVALSGHQRGGYVNEVREQYTDDIRQLTEQELSITANRLLLQQPNDLEGMGYFNIITTFLGRLTSWGYLDIKKIGVDSLTLVFRDAIQLSGDLDVPAKILRNSRVHVPILDISQCVIHDDPFAV